MAEFGEKVLVHCVGRLDDGRVFENSRQAGAPVAFKLGEGRFPLKVERALCDMLPGNHMSIRLEPAEAYGVYDEQLVQHVPVQLLSNADKLPVGSYVDVRTRMGALRAKVVLVNEAEVVLDCNHELAGQAITYDIELVSIVHDSAIERELHPAGCACGCDKLKQQIG